MKILLDESTPQKLRLLIDSRHAVATTWFQGWSGLKNGALLDAIANAIDAAAAGSLDFVDIGPGQRQTLSHAIVGPRKSQAQSSGCRTPVADIR